MIILMMILAKIFFNDLLLPFKFGKYIFTYKYANYMINKENDEIEKENKEKNEEAAKQYIKAKYGEAVSSIIEIEYKGRISGWAADSHYIISAPFVDDASIYVESETQDVRGGFNFSKSSKFQHLYSEWIKKQIGVDDENVEFGFTGSYETPYVEFEKITSLSEDYSEVFENTHNFYVWTCEVGKINNLNNDNKVEIAKNIRENYLISAMKLTDMPKDERKNFDGCIVLSNKNFDKENDINYFFHYDAKKNNSPLIESSY